MAFHPDLKVFSESLSAAQAEGETRKDGKHFGAEGNVSRAKHARYKKVSRPCCATTNDVDWVLRQPARITRCRGGRREASREAGLCWAAVCDLCPNYFSIPDQTGMLSLCNCLAKI